MHNEQEYREQLQREGFWNIYVWEDDAEQFYAEHTHPGLTAHIVLDGELTLVMDGQTHRFHPGDRCDVPAGARHSALIGARGCRYMIGQK